MWAVSLILAMLYYVGNVSYIPHVLLRGEFLLQAPCYVMWGVSLTRPMLFFGVVSLTRPMLFCVGSFSYTPHAVLCGEFLLHSPCYIMWGVSLTRPMQY